MIQEYKQIFGSNSKAQEIIFLLHDLKEVVRHGFYDQELLPVKQFCQKHHLHLVKAPYKVILSEQEGYSNKGYKVTRDDPTQGLLFTYIAKEKKQAQLACYYETIGNHHELGKLLGYPLCCINYFVKEFSPHNSNPQHLPTTPWTNITLRDQDIVLLSHFPCHSECSHSVNLAKKYFNLLRIIDPLHAQRIAAYLRIET